MDYFIIVSVMELLNNILWLHARSEAIRPRKGFFPPSLASNLDEKINKSSFEAHTLDEIPLMGLPLWAFLKNKIFKIQPGNRSGSLSNLNKKLMWRRSPQQENSIRFPINTVNTVSTNFDQCIPHCITIMNSESTPIQ